MPVTLNLLHNNNFNSIVPHCSVENGHPPNVLGVGESEQLSKHPNS